MSEFLIHQRFFAKLKQKAENKRKELEDSKRKGKEQPEGSPQHSHRKRPGAPPLPPLPPKVEHRAPEQTGAAASEANGAEMAETAPQTSTGVAIEKVGDSDSSSKENVATKKIKISNGVDGVTTGSSGRGRLMANGRQNSYDGGLSFAQFLAETVSSQAAEEKKAEKTCEMDTSGPGLNKDDEREIEVKCREVKDSEIVNVLVQEHERLTVRETELSVEREKEREKQTEMPCNVTHSSHSPASKSHRKSHKDHDHHNIQASISSVLHTVKDFFFGKGKKNLHDHRDKEEIEDYNPVTHSEPSPPPTPPLPQLEDYGTHPQDVPMKSDESTEPSRLPVTEPYFESREPLTPHGLEHEVLQKEHFPTPPTPPLSDSGLNSYEPRVKEAAISSQVDATPGEKVPMAESTVFIEVCYLLLIIQLFPWHPKHVSFRF